MPNIHSRKQKKNEQHCYNNVVGPSLFNNPLGAIYIVCLRVARRGICILGSDICMGGATLVCSVPMS